MPNLPSFPNFPNLPNHPGMPNPPSFPNFPNIPRRNKRVGKMGLWKSCTIKPDRQDACNSNGEMYKSGRIVEARSLLTSAMVVCIVAFLLELASYRVDKITSKLVGGVFIFAFIFGVAAMALYTDYHGTFKETAAKKMGVKASSLDDIFKLSYGWAYGFGWFAAVMALISTILAFAVDDASSCLCGTKV